jgi:NhaP-type Na+/H+ or K+/H+ antiporter
MALSIALLVLLSLGLDHLLRRLKVPGLVGMLLVGVLLGPHLLDLLSPSLLSVSSDFRRIALILLLLRAGLMIKPEQLRRIGGQVLLLACVPTLLEVAVLGLLGVHLLGLSWPSALVLGSVIAAVSPAVVVPAMADYQQRIKGRSPVPTLLLAASPLDNVFAIVLFGVLLSVAQGEREHLAWRLAELPLALLTGSLVGSLLGQRLYRLFQRFDPRATKRALIVICLAIILVAGEEMLAHWVPFSGLVAVMAMAFVILRRSEVFAAEISLKLAKMWILAEILLFVLVGAQVDVPLLWHTGLAGIALIAGGLVARSVGVWLALLGSALSRGERLVCVAAYLPKATVPAAIGATPLAVGLAGGETILAIAVLAIAVTAAPGAMLLERAVARYLTAENAA